MVLPKVPTEAKYELQDILMGPNFGAETRQIMEKENPHIISYLNKWAKFTEDPGLVEMGRIVYRMLRLAGEKNDYPLPRVSEDIIQKISSQTPSRGRDDFKKSYLELCDKDNNLAFVISQILLSTEKNSSARFHTAVSLYNSLEEAATLSV